MLVCVLVGVISARREAAVRRTEAAAAVVAPDCSGAELVAALPSCCDPESDGGVPEVLIALVRARYIWEVVNLVAGRPDVRVDGQLLERDGMLCATAFSSKEAAHASGIARDPYALIESSSGHVLSLVMQDHGVGGLVLDAGSDHAVRIPKEVVAEFLQDEDDDGGH